MQTTSLQRQSNWIKWKYQVIPVSCPGTLCSNTVEKVLLWLPLFLHYRAFRVGVSWEENRQLLLWNYPRTKHSSLLNGPLHLPGRYGWHLDILLLFGPHKKACSNKWQVTVWRSVIVVNEYLCAEISGWLRLMIKVVPTRPLVVLK